MRKLVASSTLLLAAVATFAGASMASADDKHPTPLPTDGVPVAPLHPHDDDSYAGVVISDGDSDQERRVHHELELKYGKDGAFQIPPLVLKPGVNGAGLAAPGVEPNLSGASVTGTAITSSITETSTINGNLNPAANSAGLLSGVSTTIANEPIDFSKVVLHQSTPAESFLHAASIALIALATGAVGFGGYLAVNRSARERIRLAEEEYSA